MTDFHAVVKNAIAAARATGERFYTAEHMAQVALSKIPADIVAQHNARFGTSMLSVLTRRCAKG